jgi:hypothetical protein
MPATPSIDHQATEADRSVLISAVQTELKRVGCDPGVIDGNWGPKAKDALAQFVRHAKIEVKSDYPTEDLLQQLSARKEIVCLPSPQDQPKKGSAKQARPRSIDVPRQLERKQALDAAPKKTYQFGFSRSAGARENSAGYTCK